MSCVLRVSGLTFNVDAFLKESSLEPLVVYRRGEPRGPRSAPTRPLNEDSGMNVSVSTREFSELENQIEDAILFLENHRQELRRLRAFSGVDRIALDFPIEERDVPVQRSSFPAELLSLMGELGVGLLVSIYPRTTDAP